MRVLPISDIGAHLGGGCAIYIFASQAYNAGNCKTSHADVRSKPAT